MLQVLWTALKMCSVERVLEVCLFFVICHIVRNNFCSHVFLVLGTLLLTHKTIFYLKLMYTYLIMYMTFLLHPGRLYFLYNFIHRFRCQIDGTIYPNFYLHNKINKFNYNETQIYTMDYKRSDNKVTTISTLNFVLN